MPGFAVAGAGIFGHRNVEERFAGVQLRQRDLQGGFAVRRNVAQFNLLRRERFTFGAHLCVQGVVIKRGKPQFIFDFQLAASQIPRVDFYRRDNLFVLFQARSRRLIGIDQTIKTEVIVVGIVAVVAAEFIPDIAVVILRLDPVVAPFPDIMSLNAIVLIEDVLVLRQPARSVPHRMSIFTDDARLRMRVFTKLIHQRHAGVHGGNNIDHFSIAIFFVMHQSRVIQRFRRMVHRADVTAIAGFIAQRPDDDRRMVFLRVNMANNALDVDFFPLRIVGNTANIADISKAVRFDVGFRHHKQAVDITQFVKTRIVRVVSGTHGVDVVLLHQLEIFLDAIHPNGAAFAMIVVVTVDAVQHHITVIDPEQTVAHFDITEANALWHHFQNVAVGVFQRHDQMVKIRGFC